MKTKLKNIVLVAAAALFVFGFAAWSILKPDEPESLSERRPLSTLPDINGEAILNGSFMADFEKYSLDQFPLRDEFRSLKAMTAFYVLGQKDNNGVYALNGSISKLEYPLNEKSLAYAAKRFRYVYDSYIAGTDMKVYFSAIPDKNYFMAEDGGYPSINYEELISYMRENLDFADYIDITQLLEISDYYRTDTHWRQEKIEDVAQYLGKEMGVALSTKYIKKDAGVPFYGVYYGQLALPIEPDDFYYLVSDIFNSCKAYDHETNSYIPIYDLNRAQGKDPYEMFLAGPKSVITIENPNANSQKELILFRDSFGSSIAPLLLEGYSKITLVDIRYISPNLLNQFVQFEAQDVLFLYSTSVLNNSETIK